MVQRARFDLQELLDEIIRSLKPSANEAGLQTHCDLGPDVPRIVIGDSLRLRQVLVNLLGNAIKFTLQGEVGVHAAVEAITDTDLQLRFSVWDTGIGIPPDQLGRIFQPFVQGDGSMTRKYGGNGLGLAISSQLVELMGGRIWVDSQLGRGSTFFFTVHLAPTVEQRTLVAYEDRDRGTSQ